MQVEFIYDELEYVVLTIFFKPFSRFLEHVGVGTITGYVGIGVPH
ncbi:hypothetical protein EMIT0P260_10150 [Pseudomonas sp. IT-P260]